MLCVAVDALKHVCVSLNTGLPLVLLRKLTVVGKVSEIKDSV